MNELALFAGAGGGILGGKLLGWNTVAAVEFAPFCARRLMQRQNEGHLPPFPIWDDVRTFDGRPWHGIIDVVSGGFPCQDISAAGKGAGISGERSGLWGEMARIIREVEPKWVLVENSPLLVSRGLGTVLGDLAKMGYHAEWGVLGAVDAGAPHRRDRIWIIAHSTRDVGDERRPKPEGQLWSPWATDGSNDLVDASRGRCGRQEEGEMEQPWRAEAVGGSPDAAYSNQQGLEKRDRSKTETWSRSATVIGHWWTTEPRLGRVAHGVAHRVDRLKAIGNGQVPAVAAMAFRFLSNHFPHEVTE